MLTENIKDGRVATRSSLLHIFLAEIKCLKIESCWHHMGATGYFRHYRATFCDSTIRRAVVNFAVRWGAGTASQAVVELCPTLADVAADEYRHIYDCLLAR